MEELQNRTEVDYNTKLEASKTGQQELLEQVSNSRIDSLEYCFLDFKFGK